MSEFRSTHAPRTGITAQVIHDLGPVSYTHLTLPTILRV